jgi:hypothetical protein
MRSLASKLSLYRLSSAIEGSQLTLWWEVPEGLHFPMPIEVHIGEKVQRVEMPEGRGSITLPSGVKPIVDPKKWILMDVAEKNER